MLKTLCTYGLSYCNSFDLTWNKFFSKNRFTPEILNVTTRCHCVSPNTRFQNTLSQLSVSCRLSTRFFFFFFPRTRATTACLCCEGPDQTVAKAKSGHNADSVQTSQKVRVSRRERRSNWGKRRSEKSTDRLCGVGPPGPGDQTQVQSPAVLFCCSCNIRKIMSLSPSSL